MSRRTCCGMSRKSSRLDAIQTTGFISYTNILLNVYWSRGTHHIGSRPASGGFRFALATLQKIPVAACLTLFLVDLIPIPIPAHRGDVSGDGPEGGAGTAACGR